jgi:hypothetical protein
LVSGALALLALAPAACRDRHGPPPPPSATTIIAGEGSARVPPPPASAEELALVAPLAQGSELGGYEVRDIHGVQDGVMRIVCAKARATVRLDVALAGEGGPEPPATAGKYAVYYSLKGAFPEEGLALAQKLAKVLEPHQDAPAPKGMTRFVPKEKNGTTL